MKTEVKYWAHELGAWPTARTQLVLTPLCNDWYSRPNSNKAHVPRDIPNNREITLILPPNVEADHSDSEFLVTVLYP